MCIFTASSLWAYFSVCINSRFYCGASVGQCEAEPEGVHQENSVPGHPAAQFVEDSQPWQWGTLMPWHQDLFTGQSHSSSRLDVHFQNSAQILKITFWHISIRKIDMNKFYTKIELYANITMLTSQGFSSMCIKLRFSVYICQPGTAWFGFALLLQWGYPIIGMPFSDDLLVLIHDS